MSLLLFISGGEIFLVFLFALIFFGADRIPELAKGLGKGVREFKKAADDIKKEFANSDLSKDVTKIKQELTGALEENVSKPVENMQQDFTQTFQKHWAEPVEGAARDVAEGIGSVAATDAAASSTVSSSGDSYETYDGYDESYFSQPDPELAASGSSASGGQTVLEASGTEAEIPSGNSSSTSPHRETASEEAPVLGDLPSDDFYYHEPMENPSTQVAGASSGASSGAETPGEDVSAPKA